MRTTTLGALMIAAACAAGGPNVGLDSFDPILPSELARAGDRDLESAVRMLRPRWLNLSRDALDQSRAGVIEVCKATLLVYVNGRRDGRRLSQMPASEALRVDLIRPGRPRPDGFRGCETLAGVNVIMRGG